MSLLLLGFALGMIAGNSLCRRSLGLPMFRRRPRPDISPATRGSYLQMAGRAQRGRK